VTVIYQAFRFELDPGNVTRGALASHAGGARFAYGWGLRLVKSRRGERKGPPAGFPQPKGKRSRRSFRVTTGAFGVTDERHIRLPRIGVIRTKEPTVKLLGRLQAGTARILSATVSQTAGRWYVSFGCAAEREQPAHGHAADPAIGVDIGVSALAVLSTGDRVPNPRHLSRCQRRITRRQRGWLATDSCLSTVGARQVPTAIRSCAISSGPPRTTGWLPWLGSGRLFPPAVIICKLIPPRTIRRAGRRQLAVHEPGREPDAEFQLPDRHWLRPTGTTAAQLEEEPQVVRPGPEC
jgi:hypothetical protein